MSENEMRRRVAALQLRRRSLQDDARVDAVAKQHAAGKLTARERIAHLADADSFREYGLLVEPMRDTEYNQDLHAPADGIITGSATIAGRKVSLVANDYTILGGSIGEIGMRKLVRVAQRAGAGGMPLVMLLEGGGHRIQDGQDARHFAQGHAIWDELAHMSGWTPIVAVIMGPGFAAATNYAALADYVVMVRGTSQMGMTGPAFVKAGTGEEIDKESLGGFAIQARRQGIAHDDAENDRDALDLVRSYLSYLPSNAAEAPPLARCDDPRDRREDALLDLVPVDLRKSYDMRTVIALIADRDSVFQIMPNYAKNIIVAFARLDGRAVGFIANQPMQKAGVLDAAACEKAAHFIGVCDAFGLPLIFLVDVPGFAVGSAAEATGLGRRSGRLFFELGNASVPQLSVIIRKGFSAAYIGMNGGQPSFQAETCVAWPTAEICAMSVEGSVDILFRKELAAAADAAALRAQYVQRFKNQLGAERAAEHFFIDDVIDPRDTRAHLIDTLARSRARVAQPYPRKRAISPI